MAEAFRSVPPVQRETIAALLIEDNDVQAKLVMRQLEAAATNLASSTPLELSIRHVHNLAVAIALLREGSFDVALLDLTLPDSAGLTTLELLRNAYERLPIVVITGDDNILTAQLAIHQQAQEYVVKGEYNGTGLLRAMLNAIERQRMQEALDMARQQVSRSERIHRTLVEKIPDGVLVVDEQGKVLYINPAAETMLGRKHGDFVGEMINLPLPENNDTDIAIPATDGSVHFAILRSIPTVWEGVDARILTLHDMTDRKALEMQLLRSQRMESLGTLAGGIAHDLNNLLSPIMLGVQALLRNNADEKQTKILSMIEQSTRRGAELVRQVLNFARGSDTTRELVSPAAALSEVQRLIAKSFPDSISIHLTECRSDIPFLLADATQLHQVLMNLVLNARDAMPRGGTLTISAQFVRVDSEFKLSHRTAKEGDFVLFTIQDTGVGISEDVKQHIFEPFYTTKEPGKGTGLGLYTVLNITKRHNGFVEIDTTVGKGTSMRVYFPVAERAMDEEHIYNVSKGQHYGNGQTVLVVDDEATLRDMASQTLRSFGYNVITAGNGNDAINVFRQNSGLIDIVLLDLLMPDMAGADVVRSLHSMDTGLRIVVSSGLVEQKYVEEVDKKHVRAFLAKPYTTDMLLNTLYDALR